MKPTKILVPLDGSALAEAAIPTAVSFVRDNPGATLTLLRAAHAASMPGADSVLAQVAAVQEAEEYLAEASRRLAREGITNVKTSVWYGAPAAAIVEAAEVRKMDLIVMNTHGRSGLGRLIMGSVAESVLRGTRTPILVLRGEGAPVDPPAGTAAARPTAEVAHV